MVGLTTIDGLESIAVSGSEPTPFIVLVVKVETAVAPGAVTPVPPYVRSNPLVGPPVPSALKGTVMVQGPVPLIVIAPMIDAEPTAVALTEPG